MGGHFVVCWEYFRVLWDIVGVLRGMVGNFRHLFEPFLSKKRDKHEQKPSKIHNLVWRKIGKNPSKIPKIQIQYPQGSFLIFI